MNNDLIIIIIAGSAITYGLKLGGLLLADYMPEFKAFRRVLSVLPGTILLAMITPDIVNEGWPGLAALILIVFIARKSGRNLLAMVCGVLLIAFIRYFS